MSRPLNYLGATPDWRSVGVNYDGGDKLCDTGNNYLGEKSCTNAVPANAVPAAPSVVTLPHTQNLNSAPLFNLSSRLQIGGYEAWKAMDGNDITFTATGSSAGYFVVATGLRNGVGGFDNEGGYWYKVGFNAGVSVTDYRLVHPNINNMHSWRTYTSDEVAEPGETSAEWTYQHEKLEVAYVAGTFHALPAPTNCRWFLINVIAKGTGLGAISGLSFGELELR